VGQPRPEKGRARPGLASGRHLVLKAPHPSPLSAHAGFFGCRHFSKTNAFLESHGQTPIDWRVDPA
jgi:uracil-DNA glycosylase